MQQNGSEMLSRDTTQLAIVRKDNAQGLSAQRKQTRADDRLDHQDKSYGNTSISGNSRAVLGNIFHTHNYFGRRSDVSRNEHHEQDPFLSLQTSSLRENINPDLISEYDAVHALWLRSEQRIPNTCDWVFRIKDYRYWLSGLANPILILTGSVGCGKSITAGAIVESFQSSGYSASSAIAHYFIDQTRNDQITATEILRALAKQLYAHHQASAAPIQPCLQDNINTMFRSRRISATVKELTNIICDLANSIGSCVIIIDGLDVMLEPEILAFLQFLRDTFSRTQTEPLKLKLVVLCRDIVGRGIRLDNVPRATVFQIGAEYLEKDIQLFVDHEVATRQTERTITNDNGLVEKIKSVLKANSAKMFLWVKLQVVTIWDPGLSTCDDDIRVQLNSLPEGLDEIYVRCLRRIDTTNDKRSRDIAPKIFRWVASAQRPLTYIEAQEAVSMDADKMPLTEDMVLSIPVADYCANLVVHNKQTGCIEFAHPTVKDLLCNQTKLPADLEKYGILTVRDNLWCGEICLAYATMYRSKTSIVPIGKQKIDVGMVSPIFKTVSETILPFRRRWSAPRTSKDRVTVTLPAPGRPIARDVVRSKMHSYICNNWLWHTTDITPSHSRFSLFEELCFCHDEELQPWADGPSRGPAYYQRLVLFAVVHNQGPLLSLVSKYLRGQKQHLSVFRQPCPGTDSSFLHVAAALGHLRVIEVLLYVCPRDYMNKEGKSAAAVAAECHQSEAFMLLQPDEHNFGFSWRLTDISNGNKSIEILLYICAAAGNIEATRMELGRGGAGVPQEIASEAMFLACKNGHKDIASLLVSYGADPDSYYLSDDSHSGTSTGRDASDRPSYKGSSLDAALELGDSTLMDTLLSVGATFDARIRHCDIFNVVAATQGEDELLQRFVAVLANHGDFELSSGYRGRQSSWLQLVAEKLGTSNPLVLREWNKVLRMILRNTNSASPMLFTSGMLSMAADKGDRTSWLPHLLINVTDDVLIEIITRRWLSVELILSPECLEALARRLSSRGLEVLYKAIQDTVGFCSVLPKQLQQQCLLTSFINNRQFHAHMYPDKGFMGVVKEERAFTIGTSSELGQTAYQYLSSEDQGVLSHRYCQTQDPRFCWLSQAIMEDALLVRRAQTIEFFASHGAPEYFLLQGLTQTSEIAYPELESIPVSTLSGYASLALGLRMHRTYRSGVSALMWLRAYIRTSGSAPATDRLCAEYAANMLDGNFALNYPAGYGTGPYSQGIHRDILFGLYAWNYKLNRRKKKPFSKADTWYIGMKLIYWFVPDYGLADDNASTRAVAVAVYEECD